MPVRRIVTNCSTMENSIIAGDCYLKDPCFREGCALNSLHEHEHITLPLVFRRIAQLEEIS